jgi:hypothetical protein
MIAMPMRKTRTGQLLLGLLHAITQKQVSGVIPHWCGIDPSLPVREIARFPMLAVETRLLPSRQSCEHEDIETRSLPKSEFMTKRKN